MADQYKVKRKDALSRNDMSVPPSLMSEVFRLPHPAEEGKPVSGMIQLATGGFAVYDLYGVKDASCRSDECRTERPIEE